MQRGIYNSWEILNESIAIKKTDKSVFLYNGTSIPKKIREFWQVECIQVKDKHNINLIYNNKNYSAYICMLNTESKITQLLWYSDFKNKITESCSYCLDMKNGVFPYMRFKRISKDCYNVTIISNIIDKENNNVLEDVLIYGRSEGKQKLYLTTRYERNAKNRRLAILAHGLKCKVCGFDFEETYGELGSGFIEVHHVNALYSLDDEIEINPVTDLITVCSNCHKMLHRNRHKELTIEELKNIMEDLK